MASFTETATLKVKDLATPELNKINLSITRLIRNMERLQKTSTTAIERAANIATIGRANGVSSRAGTIASRQISRPGLFGVLEGQSFTQFLMKTGAALIGTSIAYHFARNMGRAIQENSKELNTARTRATIMGSNTNDLQSFRKATDHLTQKLGNVFTRGDVGNALLDVASPLGGVSQKTLPLIQSVTKDALEIMQLAKSFGGSMSGFRLQSYEQIQNETGGLYNAERRKDVRDSIFQAVATGRGLVDFNSIAYLLKMVPAIAQLPGRQLRELFIQQGLNRGSGSQNRFPLELAAFFRNLSNPTAKQISQQQTFGLRDNRGRLYDEALLKSGDIIKLQENFVLRILAKAYGIQSKDVDNFIKNNRGRTLTPKQLHYVQSALPRLFIQNVARTLLNTTQFSRSRNKDIAAAERLQPLDTSFQTARMNIDQQLINTANSLNNAFVGLWNNIKNQSGPALSLIQNIANKAQPYLDNTNTLNAGVAAGAVGLGAYAVKRFGALGVAGTGASLLTQDPSIGLNIAAANLNASAAALEAAAGAQAAGGIGGMASGAAAGWTFKGFLRGAVRSFPSIVGAIGLSSLSGSTKQPSELERRTQRAHYDRIMGIDTRIRALDDQNKKNALSIQFAKSNSLRNDYYIADLQANMSANTSAINALYAQRKRENTSPLLDQMTSQSQIPNVLNIQNPWQQNLQAQSDLTNALWKNTDSHDKNTKVQQQQQPDDSKLQEIPPMQPYKATNVGYRGGC